MFKKYNSIENSYREEFLNKIVRHGWWNEEYVVQEKVHGANLSYWSTNGTDFYAAKRTEQIEEGDPFYNHALILEEVKPALQNIWNDLSQELSDMKQMTVFGEIFGGDYPHDEVEWNRKAVRVQKGIYYSPNNHFYAFDIQINTEKYLDVDRTNQLFSKYNLLHAKTLFRGSLEDCLKHPNNFNSTIPQEFNLPPLDPNVVEGVIIRPVQPLHFTSGSRVILKNKNEKWAENKKYHKPVKMQAEVSEKILQLQEIIMTYVTENRLNNVISKLGTITPKDFGKVVGMFNKDVVQDFLKDYHHLTEELEKKELKLVTKSFLKTAADLVNDELKKC